MNDDYALNAIRSEQIVRAFALLQPVTPVTDDGLLAVCGRRKSLAYCRCH